MNDSGSAGKQHGRDQDVAEAAEDNVDHVRDGAVPGLDDLEEGMGIRRASLELNGQGGEQDDLHGGTGGVPERAGNTAVSSMSVY